MLIRCLDLAAEQLVLTESCEQIRPVPWGEPHLIRPVPGSAALSRGRANHGCLGATTSERVIHAWHPRHTDIWLNALLEVLVDLDQGIADLVQLIALPWNGQQHLPSPAAPNTRGDVQAGMPPVIEHRPAPPAAPLRQRLRHIGPDRHLPVTGPVMWVVC